MEIALYRNGTYPDTFVKYVYSPFTLTIEKEGFKTYNTVIPVTERFNATIALEPPLYINQFIDGSISSSDLSASITPKTLEGIISPTSISGVVKTKIT